MHGYTPPFIKLPCYKKGIVAKGNNHPLICHAVDIKYRIYTKVIGNWKIVRFHTQTKFSQMLQVGGKRYFTTFQLSKPVQICSGVNYFYEKLIFMQLLICFIDKSYRNKKLKNN